jgi:tetratricopeptide (TPR) repeat protein
MKKTLILIFLLFSLILFSQNSKIDSLQNTLFTASGSNRIKILNALSHEFWDLNPQKSIEYAENAYKLAQKEKNFPEQINALINIAVAKEVENDTASARKNYFEAIKLAEKNNVLKGLARAKKDYGILLFENYENKKSLFYLLDALRLYAEFGDTLQQSYVYEYITRDYQLLNDLDKALKYALANLKLLEKSRFKERIGDTFLILGNVYEDRNEYFDAIQNYKAALKCYQEIGLQNGMATCYNYLGNVNETLSDYDKSLSYYYKALSIYLSLFWRSLSAFSLSNDLFEVH